MLKYRQVNCPYEKSMDVGILNDLVFTRYVASICLLLLPVEG